MTLHDALVAQLLVTGFLCGLIWFVQVVHYPLMAQVGREAWPAYHRAHVRWTTAVVMPAMLVELALAVVWVTARPDATLAWVGLALVAAIWLSTFAVQVPLHDALSRGPDAPAVARLVATNWLRTVAWTARAVVAAAALR